MNTPSHLIINAALRKSLGHRIAIPRSAFLLGAVMPDIPLFLLSIGTFLYARYVQGVSDMRGIMNEAFDYKYFNDPLWIASHNFLHSPTLLLIFGALLWRFRFKAGSWGMWLFWFVMGCMMHTALDIPTHVNDGPVLFFPFDWSTRFHSPISYWDDQHYGREFAMFELTLDVLLLGYLLLPALRRRFARRPAELPTKPS
ncbi:MAG: hypothetical protein OHK0022_55520 [Roseiflexaceae bacterium]